MEAGGGEKIVLEGSAKGSYRGVEDEKRFVPAVNRRKQTLKKKKFPVGMT